jgi:hypothetical protein
MYTLAQIIYCLFPIIASILIIIGIKKNAIYYIISALWLSIIALITHSQASGGEILGSYFNYFNAISYTFNLIILLISLVNVIAHLNTDNTIIKSTNALLQAFIIIGSILVTVNIWINAYFIENRKEGTPVMQVALISKPNYCNYRYIFYKVNVSGSLSYLCPNHYGLVPSSGHLSISPDFIAAQIPNQKKKQLFLLQQSNSTANKD